MTKSYYKKINYSFNYKYNSYIKKMKQIYKNKIFAREQFINRYFPKAIALDKNSKFYKNKFTNNNYYYNKHTVEKINTTELLKYRRLYASKKSKLRRKKFEKKLRLLSSLDVEFPFRKLRFRPYGKKWWYALKKRHPFGKNYGEYGDIFLSTYRWCDEDKRPWWLQKNRTAFLYIPRLLRVRRRLFFWEKIRRAQYVQQYIKTAYKRHEWFSDQRIVPPKFWREKFWHFFRLKKWDSRNSKWQLPLIFKRKLYKTHRYFRFQQKKNPKERKKNKVYRWLNYSIDNRWKYGIKKKSFFRIKQLYLSKIILPFYGYLNRKQFLKIKNKTSIFKPIALKNSKTSIFLKKFENRLDIIVYRAGFAPTIQWARVFINMSLIYINDLKTIFLKNRIITPTQKFPLLRFNFLKKQSCKFFNSLLATNSINYPVEQKSIVHCLMRKSLRVFFYIKHFRRKRFKTFIYSKNKTAVFIFKQPIQKNICRTDRIKEHTLNWTSL